MKEATPKLDSKHLEQLKKNLSSARYDICFRSGTEPPFSGELTFEKGEGTYACVVCATPLFSSKTKFISKTGWPSFDAPLEEALEEREDASPA